MCVCTNQRAREVARERNAGTEADAERECVRMREGVGDGRRVECINAV